MTEFEEIGGTVRANVVPVPFAVNWSARIVLSSGAKALAVIVAEAGTLTRL